MVDQPEIEEINQRFKPLMHELRPPAGMCPFIADGPDAKYVAVSHYRAGRDATCIHVARKRDSSAPFADLAVTIRYAPFVEGTAIIYDLLHETMQGKARPFVCDLAHRFLHIYMLLPLQIEKTSMRIEGATENRAIHISFLDACDEIIQAALPFELRIIDSNGNVQHSSFASTNRQGHFTRELAPLSSTVQVHCCLTGHDESLRV